MKTNKTRRQETNRKWAALDWGVSEHAVAIVSEDREVLDEFKVPSTPSGFAELESRLQAAAPVAGIAIESTRNPVLRYLEEKSYTIYPVNPKLSKSWRDSNSVGGAKSDERHSRVLALELARRHESLRPLKPSSEKVAQLAGLCESLRAHIDQRTAHLQRLKAVLRQYYGGVLSFYSDWSSPAAWRFLNKFPCPEKLARARESTLLAFLKANRIGLKPVWLERIQTRRNVLDWPRPANSISLELTMLATVAQLQALQPFIDKFDKLIKEKTEEQAQAELIESLPGAGVRLAPALTAMVLSLEGEADRSEALRCLSGTAPIEVQSGKHRRVSIRRRCNKHWRDILHLFARCSTISCPWAKAYYDLRREQGDRHATALRKLADKWLKIINSMLVNNEHYDDQKYLAALRKSGSPVYERLCGNHGG